MQLQDPQILLSLIYCTWTPYSWLWDPLLKICLSNLIELDITTWPDHWIFCVHIGIWLTLKRELEKIQMCTIHCSYVVWENVLEACLYSTLLEVSAEDRTTERNQCRFDMHVFRLDEIIDSQPVKLVLRCWAVAVHILHSWVFLCFNFDLSWSNN